MRMKRYIPVLAAVLFSVSACGKTADNSNGSVPDVSIAEQTTDSAQESTTETTSGTAVTGSYTAAKSSAQTALTNKKTDFERACVEKRPFSHLDDAAPAPDVKIGNVIVTKEALTALYQSMAEPSEYLSAAPANSDLSQEHFS